MPAISFANLIAHRGASAHAPENTLAAFAMAADLGAKWIEFDLTLSKDNVPIVWHDSSLDRCSDGRGLVDESTYAALQELDCGSWFSAQFQGQKIATLEQVLALAEQRGLCCNIELKPPPGRNKELLAALLKSLPNKLDLIVSSFHWGILRQLREQATKIPIALLIDSLCNDWQEEAQLLQCSSLHINQNLLNEQTLPRYLAPGYPLLAYTVNQEKRGKFLLDHGVTGVFSDYPELFTTL